METAVYPITDMADGLPKSPTLPDQATAPPAQQLHRTARDQDRIAVRDVCFAHAVVASRSETRLRRSAKGARGGAAAGNFQLRRDGPRRDRVVAGTVVTRKLMTCDKRAGAK